MRFHEGRLLFADFNQDCSRLSVGTCDSYQVFSVDSFRKVIEKKGEPTSIISMLFNTSLVAQVGWDDEESSQRCLRMINTKREKEIIRMNYNTPILAVRLNRQRLVVVLQETIYIYDITNMHLVHVISSVPANPRGVCALSSCHVPDDPSGRGAHNFLAYPGSSEKGDVYVYDVINLRLVAMIEAHTSGIGCLAFNNKGDRLATASEKGTVFRVFAIPSGDKLFELRRGVQTTARIYSMSFSADSTLLAVSSDKPTIHIFKLDDPAPPAEESKSWLGYMSDSVKWAGSFAPTAVSELFTQMRNFAHITLEKPIENVVVLGGTKEKPVALVASADGYLRKYPINMETGGQCHSEGQFHVTRLSDGAEEEDDEAAASGDQS